MTSEDSSEKNPPEATDINNEEEKENICVNLTAADNRKKRSTKKKKDNSVGQIKRKAAPNGVNNGKRKKPNIVQSLSRSLNEENNSDPELTEDVEEVIEDINQIITSNCIEECTNKSEVSDEFAAQEVKKRVKSKKEETAATDRSLTNEDIDEDCDREFCPQDRVYIKEINNFMKETSLNLKAFPPTKGDGNCWFRAISDQVVIQNIPNKAKNHRALRLEVCDHVKMLPEDILEPTIAIVFNGKKRGLNEMVARQRKAGQWVDNSGIMVMTTAHYLARNIHLYSYRSETKDNTRPYSLTKIEAGPGAENCPPVTVFFYDKHYQTLQPDTPNQEEDGNYQ